MLTAGLQSEFGLPNFKKLVPAEKAHLWIAACDILALVGFLWQVIAESLGGPSNSATAFDALSAVRLWFASTLRATCIFVIITMTLLHVRLARPVDFGKSHWLIWGPGLLLTVTSTVVAGEYLCSCSPFYAHPPCRRSCRFKFPELVHRDDLLLYISHFSRCCRLFRSRRNSCYHPAQPYVHR